MRENAAMANDQSVADLVNNAEAIFIAGGDQTRYINEWKGTALGNALANVNPATRAIAGSSAEMAILGDTDYSAEYGSASSSDALADPYNRYMNRFETNFLDVTS